MIAAVERDDTLCIVKRVRREGFKAAVLTYCGANANASDGTVQVPDAVFREGTKWLTVEDKRPLEPCTVCRRAAKLG